MYFIFPKMFIEMLLLKFSLNILAQEYTWLNNIDQANIS